MSEPMPSSFIIFVAVALIVAGIIVAVVALIAIRSRRRVEVIFEKGEFKWPKGESRSSGRVAESEWRCAASGCNAPQGECLGVCPPCNQDCRQGRKCTKKSV